MDPSLINNYLYTFHIENIGISRIKIYLNWNQIENIDPY